MSTYIVLCFLSTSVALICMGITIIGYTWLNAIGRNPEASNKLQTPAVIISGFLEVPLLILIIIIYMYVG